MINLIMNLHLLVRVGQVLDCLGSFITSLLGRRETPVIRMVDGPDTTESEIELGLLFCMVKLLLSGSMDHCI